MDNKYSQESTNSKEAGSRVYNVVDPNNDDEMTRNIYDKWAEQYDNDVVQRLNYACPALVVSELAQIDIEKEAKILDIGAGTGLLGIELRKAGYVHVDAVEPSQEMINKAIEQGLYERSIVDFVGTNRLDIPDDTYDVITGAGVFVPSHIKPDAFPELHRITKIGGVLLIVCSERYYEKRYDSYAEKLDEAMTEFVKRGLWAQIRRSVVPGYLENYKAHVTVMRKLKQ